jgi:signal transduction histidine kinase
MLQRLGIRGKILAVVAVPILVLMLAAGFVTYGATQDLNEAQRVEGLLETLDTGRELARDLQEERFLGVNYVAAFSTYTNRINAANSLADERVVAITEAAEGGSSEAQAVYDRMVEVFEGPDGGRSLEELRSVQPSAGEDGWLEWLTDEEMAAFQEEYAAIENGLLDLRADSGSLDPDVTALRFQVARERDQKLLLFAEAETLQTGLEEVTERTTTTAAAFQRQVAGIEDVAQNNRVRESAAALSTRLDELEATHSQVQFRTLNAPLLTGWYTDTLVLLTIFPDEVASTVVDADLKTDLQGFGSMDVLIERLNNEEVLGERLIRAGTFGPGEAAAQRRLLAETDIALINAQRIVNPLLGDDVEVPDYGASSGEVGDTTSFESVRSALSTGLDINLIGQRGSEWGNQVAAELEPHEAIREELWNDAEATSGALAQATLVQSVATIAAVVLVVVASLFIALLIARRIVGPLRRLTTTATAVRQELPRLVERVALPGESVDVSEVQIPVESSDEVGRLAEAFNSVNAATLAIAGEQAALRSSISEMFVNVARRDQVLLNRQLASIDEMERTEDNPNTLTRLFALDHLATRMRRNSESLLVLAGIDTGRRLRRPMPLSDVIRTASSEIELYERVQLELDADPAMVGHSALTAAHLFAELLENATVFSDPGTPVVVRTSERDGDFIVEVIDGGIGMTPEELQEANSRVASTAASEILGAQRLGLFVVGRIARRVGARVEILSKEGEGTTSVVTMPTSMFDMTAEVDHGHTSTNAVDSAMHVPAALVTHNTGDEEIDTPGRGTPAVATVPEATRPPISLPSYQPTAIEQGASLLGRDDDIPVETLIANDAASAPVGVPADPEGLTDGTTSMGLPTRRRKQASDLPAQTDSTNIIGLPARATADQLSALEAEAPTGFTPAVAANEVSPQSAEERASMFRGFRPRREATEPVVNVEPDAESMGQAARRGAVAPDEIPALEEDATPAAPELEPDADAPAASVPVDSDELPRVAQSPLISSGYETDDAALLSAPSVPMVVPLLEDDEPEFASASPEPAVQEPAGVDQVSLVEDDPTPTFPLAAAFQTPHAQAPASAQSAAPTSPYAAPPSQYAAPVATPPVEPAAESAVAAPTPAPVAAAPVQPPVSSTPSLDELIAGSHVDEGDKSGFFGKLFGRSKKDEEAPTTPAPGLPARAMPPAPVTSAPAAPPAFQPTNAFHPTIEPDPVPAPAPAPTAPVSRGASLYPEQTEPIAPAVAPVAPNVSAPYPSAFQPDPETVDTTHQGEQWSADAFAAAAGPSALSITPPESLTPYNPGNPGTAAPQYTANDLANPHGWETAGASALEASQPDVTSTYIPVVDIQPAETTDDNGVDISDVFSELSSLSAERPKVEKTRAGLQKRRSEDSVPVQVTPIEEPVEATPANRNAEELRNRFSSFYSGTHRARQDVAELDKQSHPASAKD